MTVISRSPHEKADAEHKSVVVQGIPPSLAGGARMFIMMTAWIICDEARLQETLCCWSIMPSDDDYPWPDDALLSIVDTQI